MRKLLLVSCAAFALSGCQTLDGLKTIGNAESRAAEEAAANSAKLAGILDAQDEDTKARYDARNPQETVEFFGIEPGMTVVDTIAGQTWYAGILSDYLGTDGRVIAADYAVDMWALFGGFANEEFLERRASWPQTFVETAAENIDEDDAPVSAFAFGSMPDEFAGTADVVMMVRAVHHLNRFEEDGDYFTKALGDVATILKPGGILGVVQHRAPETNSDKASEGDNGYVKQSHVIAFIENAGFELVGTSEVNANPRDVPTDSDFVWRLPPTLGNSADDEELRATYVAIGESDRMTLKFRKK